MSRMRVFARSTAARAKLNPAAAVTAILLLASRLSGEVIRQYRKLKAEAGPSRNVVLLAPSAGRHPSLPPDITLFPLADAPMADLDLPVLQYARRHPWYLWLWVISEEVAFSGRWGTLFDAFDDSRADLLATTVCGYETMPGWEHWDSLMVPGQALPRHRWLHAFLPLYRLSRSAVNALDEAYRSGWGGHFAAALPTILADAGLALEDIGGDGPFVAPGNRNRFYVNTPGTPSLSPGSLVHRPLRLIPGARPDQLWYPVGPPAFEPRRSDGAPLSEKRKWAAPPSERRSHPWSKE